MEQNDQIPKPHPIVEKLEEISEKDSVVRFEGYVGSRKGNMVRLYSDLTVRSYIDIPAGDVICFSESPERRGGRTRLYVTGSSQVRRVSIGVEMVPARELIRGRGGEIRRKRGGGDEAGDYDADCALKAFEDFLECQIDMIDRYGDDPDKLREEVKLCSKLYKQQLESCRKIPPIDIIWGF